MTAIELFRFITENKIEWHWQDDPEEGIEDVLIFLYYHQIEDLAKLLPATLFDDSGIPCSMKYGYIAIWMHQIVEHFGIELDEVFPKE